jgi:hypothetical protein
VDSLSLSGTETYIKIPSMQTTHVGYSINKPSSQLLLLPQQLSEVQCLQPAEYGNNPRNSFSRKHSEFSEDFLSSQITHYFILLSFF